MEAICNVLKELLVQDVQRKQSKCAQTTEGDVGRHLYLALCLHDAVDFFFPKQCNCSFHAVLQVSDLTWPIPAGKSTLS